MLKKEGMITGLIIDNMQGRHHSGFNMYCGKTLWPGYSQPAGTDSPILRVLLEQIPRNEKKAETDDHIPL